MKRLAVLLVLCLSLVGCKDSYGTAAKLSQDIAVSIGQADMTIDALRVQGGITVDEERNILGWLDSLNTFNGQYITCVQAAHGQSLAGGFTKCANTFLSAMGQPGTLTALHIKNAAKQADILATANGIEALVTATISALGGQ